MRGILIRLFFFDFLIHLYDAITHVKVPIIMGYNRDEGLLLTWNFLKDKDKLKDFNSDIEKNLLSIAFGR